MDETCISQIEALQKRLHHETAVAEAALAAVAAALMEIAIPLGMDVSSIESIALPSHHKVLG
jgi:hypothetical protein